MKTSDRISFRQMTPQDLERVVEIITSYSRFDGEYARDYYNGYFERTGDNPNPHEQNHVAMDPETGKVAGVCGFAQDKYKLPGIYWLTWFYVDADDIRSILKFMIVKHRLREALSYVSPCFSRDFFFRSVDMESIITQE